MRRSSVRNLGIGLFVASISFFNYGRLTGCDCIRAIHIVTLLVCGMGLGLVVVSLIMLIRGKRNGK